MSQRFVEAVIGQLATDEAFRRSFQEDRAAVLDDIVSKGAEITPVERRALLDLDFSACERFAERLDPRIQKICLRRNQ